jgi:hypothetical protein
MKRVNWVLCSVLLPMILLSGCMSVESSWRKAQQQNTIVAYDSFLQQYPDSGYAQTAHDAIESLKFKQAEKAGTTEAFESYLREYPTGQWSEKAKDRIAEAEQKKREAAQRYENVKQNWSKLYTGLTIDEAEKLVGPFVKKGEPDILDKLSEDLISESKKAGSHGTITQEYVNDLYTLVFVNGKLQSWKLQVK